MVGEVDAPTLDSFTSAPWGKGWSDGAGDIRAWWEGARSTMVSAEACASAIGDSRMLKSLDAHYPFANRSLEGSREGSMARRVRRKRPRCHPERSGAWRRRGKGGGGACGAARSRTVSAPPSHGKTALRMTPAVRVYVAIITASSLHGPSPAAPTARTRKLYFLPLCSPVTVTRDFGMIFACSHAPGSL